MTIPDHHVGGANLRPTSVPKARPIAIEDYSDDLKQRIRTARLAVTAVVRGVESEVDSLGEVAAGKLATALDEVATYARNAWRTADDQRAVREQMSHRRLADLSRGVTVPWGDF
jgi:hypothetical protein